MGKMTIDPNLIQIGNKSIPTKHIAQASIWKDESYKKKRKNWLTLAICAVAIVYFTKDDRSLHDMNQLAAVGVIVALLIAAWYRPRYELHLSTTGGDITALSSKNQKFMQEVHAAVTNVISGAGGNTEYKVNIDAKTITEAPRINVHGSSGVFVNTGEAEGTALKYEISGVALHGINELANELRKISDTRASNSQALLEEFRSQVMNGTTKTKALEVWNKFTQSLNAMTGVTIEVWNLVATVQNAFKS